MTPTDEILKPWIWHAMDVYATSEALATKWAASPQGAAIWLSMRPGMDTSKVLAWTRVMHAAMAMAADRTKPTGEEIRECVKVGERRGW